MKEKKPLFSLWRWFQWIHLLTLHWRSIYCFIYLLRPTRYKLHKTETFVIFVPCTNNGIQKSPNKCLWNEVVIDRKSRFWILNKIQIDGIIFVLVFCSDTRKLKIQEDWGKYWTKWKKKKNQTSFGEHLHISLNHWWLMISQFLSEKGMQIAW